LPQNNSSPTVKDGTPNNPRAIASPVWFLSISLFSGVFAAAKAADASTPSFSRIAPSTVKKVVLAYSGGLDTSVILKWLQTEYGAEVVTFTADLGQGEEIEPARKKAELLGIKPENIFIEDVREEFVRDYVFPMFRANALYEGVYLLGTSIARPLIAKKQIEIAEKWAPTPSPMAPPARATTRCASSSPIMR
jgi:hypothetical protein